MLVVLGRLEGSLTGVPQKCVFVPQDGGTKDLAQGSSLDADTESVWDRQLEVSLCHELSCVHSAQRHSLGEV